MPKNEKDKGGLSATIHSWFHKKPSESDKLKKELEKKLIDTDNEAGLSSTDKDDSSNDGNYNPPSPK